MNDALAQIQRTLAPLAGRAEPAWIVGGAIRDALLGVPTADVDVAIAGDAQAAAGVLSRALGAGRFKLSAAFGSWRVHGGGDLTIDITPLQGADLTEDLARRDFTVNALAIPVGEGTLIDPHGGRDDLTRGRLRAVRPTALRADPVRLLRLCRLAIQMGLTPEAETVRLAQRDAAELARAPAERVMEELRRLIRLPAAHRGILMLDEVGALGVLVPALEDARGMEQNPYHRHDVLGHTLEVVRHAVEIAAAPREIFRGCAGRVSERLAEPLADGLTRGQALVLAALLHDMAKPRTRAVAPDGRVTFIGHSRLGAEMAAQWCERMRTSGALREFLTACTLHHLALGFLVHRTPLSLRQIDRYLQLLDPDQVELSVLSAADRLATDGPRTKASAIHRHLVLVRELTEWHFHMLDRGPIRPPVSGRDLAEHLGRAPGPWLKDLLVSLREEQVVGHVRSPAGALQFAESWQSKREWAN